MRMPLKWFGVTANFLLVLCPIALSKDKTPDPYQILLARLKQGDRTVDFLELRRAYANSREYTDGSNPDDRNAMMSAFKRGDYAEALKVSNKILNEYYLDIEAHHVAELANRELHIEEEADFHHFVANGLIEGIFKSGDCKTMETACEVLSTHEEYVILQVLGLLPGMQSLMDSGKHRYDVLEANDLKTEQKVTLYFNIDKPMGYLDRIFSK
jgi:Domain of unknown function (DUF4919)